MRQSRSMSAVETCANVGTGLLVSFGLGSIVYPAFGFPVTPAQNLGIVLIFTIASILRGYLWRRLFNGIDPAADPIKELSKGHGTTFKRFSDDCLPTSNVGEARPNVTPDGCDVRSTSTLKGMRRS